MTKLIGTLVVSGTMILLPAMARPQDDEAPWWSEQGTEAEAETAPPAMPAPSEIPPAPQADGAPAPQADVQPAAPAGQWVYTQQYGWIWMPYSDAFTYSPANGYGEPTTYVYYPAYGWTWIAAPWVWGIGPWPFFGVYGPARFAWYGHGWWRYPARWHYAPYRGSYYGFRPAPVYRGGVGYRGVRAAPVYRGGAGYGGFRPAPYRGGSGYRGGAVPFTGRGGGYGSRASSGGRGGFGSPGARGWSPGWSHGGSWNHGAGGRGSSGHGGSRGFGGHGRGRG